MDKTLITGIGLAVIGGIYWFFFGKKEGPRTESTTWNIVVDGGYKPDTITIPAGKTSAVTFTRKDRNSCLEDVIIDELNVKEYLPLNTPVTISLSPAKAGVYTIHCGMNMFHGKVRVV